MAATSARVQAAYDELSERHRAIALLSSTRAVLEWDLETKMPEAGAVHRSRQISDLAGRIHAEATHPRVAELLALLNEPGALATEGPLEATQVNVTRWTRAHRRESQLERAWVEELAEATSLAHGAWAAARAANDFAAFAPHLSTVLSLKQREARALADGGDGWDALLDDFEPGMTGALLDALFAPLAVGLRDLSSALAGAARRPRVDVLRRSVPVPLQRTFVLRVLDRIGYDTRRGRLDTSAHPFSTKLGPHDVRITTRFYEHDLTEGLFGALHEVGHALYDLGLPEEHFGTPRGEATSYGVHESQSRLWENLVGRSPAFWQAFYPELRATWPGILDDVSADEFVLAINAVEPGANRVRADEVTYNLHIFVRFQLERALLSGDLAVADLPGAWDEAYATVLGVRPPSHAEGCLQDGHWAAGLFGYFPTYTLGNMMAAQIYGAAQTAISDLEGRIGRGDVATLREFLGARVHTVGQSFDGEGLIREVCGAPLDAAPLVRTLRDKYERLRLI